jgi:hypothetical protein
MNFSPDKDTAEWLDEMRRAGYFKKDIINQALREYKKNYGRKKQPIASQGRRIRT